MSTTDLLKTLELRWKLEELRRLKSSISSTLREIELAREYLSKHADGRRIYRKLGDLIVEITREEAEEYLENAELGLKAQLSTLEEEERKLSSG